MTVLVTVRLVALAVTGVFSLIVLGLSAHLTFLTTKFFDGYFTFAALSIATAVLTMISIPVLIVVDLMRKGAFTSMVVVELAWLGFLWVLWLSSAATAADANSVTFPSGCGYIDRDVDTACREFSAIMAFGFLNWLILMGYTITLFVFAIIGANRGHRVWTSSVKETNFFAPAQGAANPAAPHFHGEKQEYIPAQTMPQLNSTMQPQYPPQTSMPMSPAPYGGQPGYSTPSSPAPTHSPYPQV